MEKYRWGVEDRMRNSDIGSPREGRKARQMKASSWPGGQAASHVGAHAVYCLIAPLTGVLLCFSVCQAFDGPASLFFKGPAL